MRQAAKIRLRRPSLWQFIEWQGVGKLTVGVCGLAAWLVLAPIGLSAQPAAGGSALVAVEFLEDGRCHVSAEGQGFRSNATYTPKATAEPGALRCAMPPVQQGLTVALTVTVPRGAARPGVSDPVMDWKTTADGPWTGTARLTEWPDVIVVEEARRTPVFWADFWGLLAMTAILAAVTLRRRRARRIAA